MDGMDGWIDAGEVHLTANILSNTTYFQFRPCRFQLGRAFFLSTVVFRVNIFVEPRARECSSGGKNHAS